MLTITAEIEFVIPNKTFSGKRYHLRPSFNFGDGLLFSGTIRSENDVYVQGQIYQVEVEFQTIENEAYALIQHLIKIGMDLYIQTGSKVIGKAILLDFAYVDVQAHITPKA